MAPSARAAVATNILLALTALVGPAMAQEDSTMDGNESDADATTARWAERTTCRATRR